MKKDNSVYIEDIKIAINKIEEYLKGIDFDLFKKDYMRQDAIIRQLEIIGEASNNISSDFIENHPDFPIKEAIRMRNFLIHGYDEVDIDVVWKTIMKDIPFLKQKVTAIFQ